MSKMKSEGYSLGSLQKQVILCLAEKGRQTINETKETIHGHYKSTNIAFHSLEKKQLIKRIGVKEYRKRKFDTFWLADKGLINAISNNADLKLLLSNVKKVYPNDKEKALLVELSTIVDKEFIATTYYLKQTTEVDVNMIVNLTIIASSQGLDAKQINMKFRELNRILRKYPKFHKEIRNIMQKNVKALRSFIRISKGVNP